jgi:surfactin synthase thioesterase subunit
MTEAASTAGPAAGAAAPSRWLIRRERRPAAPASLYCFAHAGGSPGEYVRWSDDLPEIAVWAVQLPGRASRLSERPFTRMQPLVEAIVGAVNFRPPFALFGHSLGGLVAFETARALRELGQEPSHLFLSSCPPPPLAGTRSPIHSLPDPALLAEIEQRWGPLPARVRADPAFLAIVLSYHRADIELFETYRHVAGEPLDCPLTVFAGDAEPGIPDLAGWGPHTTASFDLRLFPGHHFYLRQQRADLLGAVANAMSGDGWPAGQPVTKTLASVFE